MAININKIGELLKEKREEISLTYEDITKVLCLRKSIIEAIETGNKDILPHEVYLRGYIKEYATLLNIYDEVAPYLIEKPPPEETIEDKKAEEKHHYSSITFSKKILIYPSIACILVITFFIFDNFFHDKSSFQSIQNTSTSVTTQMEPTNIEQKEATPAQLSSLKRLMITCHERTWVSVVIDDSEKKEFMLNPHEMIFLNAKENFDLLIGNAGGVRLFLNGKDTEFSGKNGEVKRIKLY